MWMVIGRKHQYVRKPGGLEVMKTCPRCMGPAKFFEVVPKEYFTVYWVPLFPIPSSDKEPVLECSGCHDRYRLSPSDHELATKQMRAPAGKPGSTSSSPSPGAGAEVERVVLLCPACNAGARVPKVRDRIRVTCPKCTTRFEVHDGTVVRS
jgi:hypothetical protein